MSDDPPASPPSGKRGKRRGRKAHSATARGDQKDARIRELVGAIRRETADHKPSVATGLPCKCFLCAALARSEGGGA